MIDQSLAVSIQHLVKDVLHRAGATDGDQFALRLSRTVAAAIAEGSTPPEALDRGLKSTRTQVFRTHRIARAELRESMLARFEEVGHKEADASLQSLLEGFATYAESQLARVLKSHRDEEFTRSQVQTYLRSVGVTTREGHEGAGQTDILLVRLGSDPQRLRTDLIEVKVPRTPSEFEDGLVETAQYAKSRSLAEAYYVVIDHCPDLDHPRYLSNLSAIQRVDGIDIHMIRIRVADKPPSKVGRARRREEKSAPTPR